jgi:Domain of unknown function (DUF4412)
MSKQIAILFFLLFGGFAFAQDGFEGTIEFNFRLSGDQSEQLSQAFPTHLTLKIKDKKMRGKTTGGQLSKMFSGYIFDGETNSVFLLSPALETAMKIQSLDGSGVAAGNQKVGIINTGETTTLAGHKCTKYIANEEEGKKGKIVIWATTDFSVEKPKDLGNLTGNMFMEGVDGFPLKVVTSQEGLEITMEVSEVRKEKIDPSSFEIPLGYRVQPIDFSLLSSMLPGFQN